MTLAYPTIINSSFTLRSQGSEVTPCSSTPNLTIAQRLTIWERSYHRGKFIPLTVASSSVAWLAFSHISPGFFKGRMSEQWSWSLLKAGALTTLSLIPFTVSDQQELGAIYRPLMTLIPLYCLRCDTQLVAIMPTNKKLAALREDANNEKPIDEGQAETLMKSWAALHNVRCVAAYLGFLTSVGAFLL